MKMNIILRMICGNVVRNSVLKHVLLILSLAFCGLSPVLAQGFKPTGSLVPPPAELQPMATPRSEHTATLLNNGKVLIVGGYTGTAFSASAELYDAATGLFQAAGSLKTGRAYHTATLLSNGKVLIVGGYSQSGSRLASTELYDPETGTFSAAGNLTTGRAYHTATLLNNGKVLIAGGSGNSDALASAELYDSSTNTFSPTVNMPNAHARHTATLLNNGKVLIAGGGSGASYLYNPLTETFSETGNMWSTRSNHTATLLNDGTVLITGGVGGYPIYKSSAEIYNPADGTFRPTSSMNTARYDHTATLLNNGKVLITGGRGEYFPLPSAELYDPSNDNFSYFSSTAEMRTRRHNHTATLLLTGKVLVAGGTDSSYAPLSSAELYDPATGTFGASQERPERRSHNATLLGNGKVLITGGLGYSDRLSSAELYDTVSGTFRATSDQLAMRDPYTTTLLGNGKVLVTGAYNSYRWASAELYDPVTDSFSPISSSPSYIATYASLTGSGKVLLLAMGNNYASLVELYDPATDTFSVTGSMVNPTYIQTVTMLADGKVLVTGKLLSGESNAELYDPATESFSPTGNTLEISDFPETTLLSNGKVLFTGGYQSGVGTLSSAELYDPSTGTFSTTGSMAVKREAHTATLLNSGKVLIAGGRNFGEFASAELYDPSTGTFSGAGTMISARAEHTATLLTNGNVLVVGGIKDSKALSSAELYVDSPTLSINDVTVTEGNPPSNGKPGTKSFVFTVTRSVNSGTASVNYATRNGSAVAGNDYINASGMLNFAEGETSKTITITINSDTLNEADENFRVVLTGAKGATLLTPQGIGTILNDDRAPGLAINNVTITEGNSGTTNANFTVTLSAISGQNVSINAIPVNGSAKSPADYNSGGTRLVFAPGETIKTFSVPIVGDTLDEDNENFYVLLSSPVNASLSQGRGIGTIIDNDSAPSIHINDISISEGNGGQRTAVLFMQLSAPSGKLVQVNYATADGTAKAGTDYIAVPTTQISFGIGQTTALARVVINGDTQVESDETLFVLLSGTVNAGIGKARGSVIITNDDASG